MMVIFNDAIKTYVLMIHKTSMFYEPLFRAPRKNAPPQISPPVCKIWRFLGPPPDPPFFEVLARDPLGHDPWPPTFMNFFDLMV